MGIQKSHDAIDERMPAIGFADLARDNGHAARRRLDVPRPATISLLAQIEVIGMPSGDEVMPRIVWPESDPLG